MRHDTTLQIENFITIELPDHGFLLLFNICFVSILYHYKVIVVSHWSNKAELLITVAIRNRGLEVRSPVDIELRYFSVGLV